MLTDTPEIKVNGKPIPAAAIDTEVQYHPAESRREAMTKAAQSLIIAELLKQRTVTMGLSESDENLKSAKDDSMDDKQQDANIDKLLQMEVDTPQATEIECQRYYESNTQKFKTAPLVEAKHILISADPEDIEGRAQAKSAAENLLTQLTEGTSQFTELARKYSACPSKEVGGSLGQISHGQTVPEFQRQLFASSAGLMASPIETRYGYHIVFVERNIEGQQLPYDQVKERIAEFLNEKVERKAIAQYLQNLISDANIEGFDFNIENSPLMQ